MTMILTCLTKDYIVQASDRRLTRTVNRRVEVFEDQSNKALIYRNHFVFAYTGRAKLTLISAIDWAAQRLSESKNLDSAVYHLRDRATDLMNNYYSSHRPNEKMLAFVGAGFGEIKVNGRWELKPLCIVISNFREKNGTWLDKPRKEFRIDVEALPERLTFELFNAGQQLTRNRKDMLNKLIMWCLRHKNGPETIGRLLTREIQAAAESNTYVGKNIMCTFVPRVRNADDNIKYHFGAMLLNNPGFSAEPQSLGPVEVLSVHHRFALPPPFDSPRFVYIRGDDKALPYEGPVYVVPGKIIPPMSISEVSITVPPFMPIQDHQADTSP